MTAPTGALSGLVYTAEPATVCTVDQSTGALEILGIGDCVVTVASAGTADYEAGSSTFTVKVESAGTLVLNLSSIATDDVVNIAEKAAGFEIAGDTGTEPGVSVTVRVGTEELTAESSDDGAGTARWTVSVPQNASYLSGTGVEVRVSASKAGFTAPTEVVRTLSLSLVGPVAPTYTEPSSLRVGEAITAMSPGGGAGIAAYGATGLPSGLVIDGASGVISGTPDRADADPADATVTVTDAAGNPATVSLSFPAVSRGAQVLAGFEYSSAAVTYGGGVPTVTAPTGALSGLVYTAEPATVCTVDQSTGALEILGIGDCVVTVASAGTADYEAGSSTFTVKVESAGTLVLNVSSIATDDVVNIAEKASGFGIAGDTGTEPGVSVTVRVGTEELTAESSDDGAGTARWTVSVPQNASYLSGTGVEVRVSASKAGFTAPAEVVRTLSLSLVGPVAPTYTEPSSLRVGEAITAMSPGRGAGIAAYVATGLPSGLVIDGASGVISGTPDRVDASPADTTVTVTDAAGNPATVSLTFPAVSRGAQVLAGFGYSSAAVTYGGGVPTVTAPTGALSGLVYTAEPATVCTVDQSTGALEILGIGDCVVTVASAGTADYEAGSSTFTVKVESAGTLVLNLSSIATDDVVNIAEKASGFGIAGDTGTEPGVSVTVRVGTEELTAESSDDGAGTARWTVSVPADASYLSGTGVEVRVSASKAGFTAPTEVVRTLSLSLVGPVAPTYTEPSSLPGGRGDHGDEPRRGSGDCGLRGDGSAVGSRDRRGERRDQRDAGPGGRESRGCDGDGDGRGRGTRRRYRCRSRRWLRRTFRSGQG